MIVSSKDCPRCKAKDSLKEYDGSLGYEAIYCPECGYFTDHLTEGQDDYFKNKT